MSLREGQLETTHAVEFLVSFAFLIYRDPYLRESQNHHTVAKPVARSGVHSSFPKQKLHAFDVTDLVVAICSRYQECPVNGQDATQLEPGPELQPHWA